LYIGHALAGTIPHRFDSAGFGSH